MYHVLKFFILFMVFSCIVFSLTVCSFRFFLGGFESGVELLNIII